MNTHTPGPWTVGMNADHLPCVVADVGLPGSGFAVAHINKVPLFGKGGPAHEANARLIAAAPDMLKALKTVTEFMACTLEDDEKHPAWDDVRLARAAIAKAEGRS